VPGSSLVLVELTIGNMRILKVICILFCLLGLVSTFAGLQPTEIITKHIAYRTYSFLIAVLFGFAAYGIHKRKPMTWKLGWILIVATSLEALFSALSHSLKLPTLDCWIASSVIVIGNGLAVMFVGFLWKRQKPYFIPNQNQMPGIKS
jgi:hypothetical protein